MPKFTSSTKHEHVNLDAKILAPLFYTYEDMRGNMWQVQRTEDGWRATPVKETYGIKPGHFTLAAFGQTGTANAASEMVLAIDEQGDIWTKKQKATAASSSGGWLLVLLALVVLTRKGPR